MSRMALAGLLAFVVGAFALPTEAAFSLVFYLAVMVPAAIGWRGLRPAEGADWLALGLIIWSALSLLWGVDDGHRAWLFLLGAVATSVFVLVLREALRAPGWGRRLAAVVVWSGTANAVLVLLFHAGALLRGERILGWGMTRQPILGGSVMAVACLTAMSARGLGLPFADGVARMALLRRLAYPGAAIVTAGFVVAMQSRGALLGLVGGTLVLAWRRFRWRALMMAVGLARGIVAAGPNDVRRPLNRMILERGTSHRPEIWARSWAMIRERPVFGHGLAANLPGSPTGFPHSLYLSLLFYSGAVGFLLFAGLAWVVTLRLLRAPPGPLRVWVAALWGNALLAGITDFGQITKGPGPLWLILWLPVVLALSLPVTPREEGAVPPAAAS